MSNERAKRRAQREAVAAEERRTREAKAQRAATRATVASAVVSPMSRTRSRLSRWHRRTYPQGDPFARRRRRQAGVVLVIFLVVQMLTWWRVPSLGARLGVLAISVLLAPVVRLLLFDRR